MCKRFSFYSACSSASNFPAFWHLASHGTFKSYVFQMSCELGTIRFPPWVTLPLHISWIQAEYSFLETSSPGGCSIKEPPSRPDIEENSAFAIFNLRWLSKPLVQLPIDRARSLSQHRPSVPLGCLVFPTTILR
jgi:hypothetical protein